MNQKFIIKLEKRSFEKIYKLSELDIPEGVNGVFQILNDEFMEGVSKRFELRRVDFNGAFKRYEG